jgi:hypothetical protein
MAFAVFLGARAAVNRRRGVEPTARRWTIAAFAVIICVAYLNRRLLE